MKLTNVAVNDFARTSHTTKKGSYYAGSWEGLIALVEAADALDGVEGFRPGVVEVTVPAEGFYAGVVDLTLADSVGACGELRARFASRRHGETPVMSVHANYPHQPAERVRIIVYSHDVLGKDASTTAPWEIVTILAEVGEEAPMPPVTMARNFLGLEGGTKGEFSAEDFAKSIIYWATHAVVEAD